MREDGRADGNPVYLTTAEAGALLGVSPPTVISWVKRGLLPAHTTPGGHRRIARAELQAFAAARGLHPARPASPAEPPPVAPVLIWDAKLDYGDTVAEYLLLRARRRAIVSVDLLEFAFHLGAHQPSAVLIGWGLLEGTQLHRLRGMGTSGATWTACLGVADPALASRAVRAGYDRCAHRGLPMDALVELILG